jgi:hypothetical protein
MKTLIDALAFEALGCDATFPTLGTIVDDPVAPPEHADAAAKRAPIAVARAT